MQWDEETREALGRLGYQSARAAARASGVADGPGWDELPSLAREHWRMVAGILATCVRQLCGDLTTEEADKLFDELREAVGIVLKPAPAAEAPKPQPRKRSRILVPGDRVTDGVAGGLILPYVPKSRKVD